MKKGKVKNIFVVVLVVVVLVGVLPFAAYYLTSHRVNIKNKDGYLIYKHFDKDINQELTDEDEQIIENIIDGKRAKEKMIACEFDKKVAVKFGKNLYCIDCDGCGYLRVNDTSQYLEITPEERKEFDKIFSKYGGTFPAV